MNWLTRLIPSIGKSSSKSKKSKIPDGVWTSCPSCESALYKPELQKTLYVCPKCDHHLRIGARTRFNIFFDNGNFTEIASNVETNDPLGFKDVKAYPARIKEAKKNTGESEALLVGFGKLDGRLVTAAAFEFKFMGGSMGSVVGEKFVQGIQQAIETNTPFICFSTSGGARMQESMVSLMQMAKVSAALARYSRAGGLFISVLTNPTMGGVAASFASLGDLCFAEPRALIGFAGPRTIKATIRVELPKGFQTSEFLLEHGAIDMVVTRNELRDTISDALQTLGFGPVQTAGAELLFPGEAPVPTSDLE